MLLSVGCSSGSKESSSAKSSVSEAAQSDAVSSEAASEGAKAAGEKQKVVIGTSAICKDVLEVAMDVFNKSNTEYEVEMKVFDDAVTPDIATWEGSIDGTFHQYKSYMDNFNESNNAKLITYGKEVFAFQIGLYSNKVKSVSEVTDGMTVALSNDVSNRAIALKLLAKEGLITLDESVAEPSTIDIKENPKNLKFVEMERLNLANAVDDTDMAVVMSDVMRETGRDAASAIAYAQEEGIQLVIKEEKPWAKDLEAALTSKEVKEYIETKTEKTKVPLF
ncbi:MAG: metal ABC transporter substrate-binding protein [Lachnospiraceae bacterium]|nr:MAG: metal ABC transporter substrate-binding protein [Lachnospiraceae bacterium]